MRNVAPLVQREVGAYFYSPIAYVVMAIFLAVSGIFFSMENFTPGGESSLRIICGSYLPVILVFILPMITMRLMSEEFRSGTIESLMTAPVSEVEVILSKFCGAMIFYLLLLAGTLLYAVLVAWYGTLDPGLLVCTYFGLVLLGALYVAVGLFFSTCTRNQVVAVTASFVLLGTLTFLSQFLSQNLDGTARVVVLQLSIISHFQDFARGLLDTNHLVFFLTTTVFFLFLSVKLLESRRWR